MPALTKNLPFSRKIQRKNQLSLRTTSVKARTVMKYRVCAFMKRAMSRPREARIARMLKGRGKAISLW